MHFKDIFMAMRNVIIQFNIYREINYINYIDFAIIYWKLEFQDRDLYIQYLFISQVWSLNYLAIFIYEYGEKYK